jgi:DNA-binding MarR family transcriptional regulator
LKRDENVDIKSLPYEIKRNPTALLVLLYLTENGNPHSIGYIAQEIGFTEAAVSKSVERLVRHRLVEKSYRKGHLGKRKTLVKVV